MSSLLEQVFDLLTTEAGSLTYHLVLAFSVAGSLLICMSYSRGVKSIQFWRTFSGLVGLLILQFGLFVISGFAWQGVVDGNRWLPMLDRTVAVLSLIIICWLWAFRDPSPAADIGVLLLVLLGLTATVFGMLWWSNQDVGVDLNSLPLDLVTQISSLCVALMGCLILLLRKSEGWGYGIAMLLLMSLGHGLQLFISQPNQDYPGAVRLGQMAAYPFLLLLPQRLQLYILDRDSLEVKQSVEAIQSQTQPSTYPTDHIDVRVWKSIYELADEDQPEKVCRGIVALLAQTMQADLCLLVKLPDENGKIIIQCGFDLKDRRYLDVVTLESRALPMLASSLRMGRSRRMASSSSSPDMVNLARTLDLERTGNLLSVPVLSPEGKAVASVVLLSPYSNKNWTTEDQSVLGDLAKLLVRFLQRSQEMLGFRDELTQMRQMTRMTQDQMQLALEERQKLSNHLAALQQNAKKEQNQLSNLRAVISAHEEARKTIEQLQVDNQELRETARSAREEIVLQGRTVDGELRLALEEIAFLGSALAEADKKVQALRIDNIESVISTDQIGTIVSIAQDLRQPLSSIVGYTDFLLSESVGILGEMQRRYMERIKVSTERIGRLIDDLIQIASLEGGLMQAELAEVDLTAIIHQTVQDYDLKLREKQITLTLELTDQPLQMTCDQKTLRKIMVYLLNNAISVTPGGGEVSIRANLETTESQQDYVLIQVSDNGGGIAPQDLPRVFSPRTPTTQIPGLGESGADLPSVKTLVEMLGGRAWVDSEPEQGATFSILLPTAPTLGMKFADEGEEA